MTDTRQRILVTVVLFLLNFACEQLNPMEEANMLLRRGDYEGAFVVLQEQAEQGHALAQLELGKVYARHGAELQDPPIDYDHAIRWFRRAADQGLSEAQYWLGLMYDPTSPEPVIPDADEALKWYSLAASRGFPDAQYQLGSYYDQWKAPGDDLLLAAMWYAQAAEQGHGGAQYQLGLMYEKGHGIPQDLLEAERLFRLAADAGSSLAQRSLASVLAAGTATATDDQEHRLTEIRFAAEELGYPESQFSLAQSYERGFDVPVDLEEAAQFYKMAADSGLADAQHALCRLFWTGQGVPQDASRSYDWCLAAAEQGHAGAANQLGFLYASGIYVDKNDEEAVVWFRMGADAGDTTSQKNLAVMYSQGRVIPDGSTEAVRWLRLAATRGNAEAQTLLGARYLSGNGVPMDAGRAFMWYEYAARNGDPDPSAQYRLALMYRDGIGVASNRRKMLEWLEVASQNGNADAAEELETMFTVVDDSCAWANDGECDEPSICTSGTDDTDCKIVPWVMATLQEWSPSLSNPDFEFGGRKGAMTCQPVELQLAQRTENVFTGSIGYLLSGEDPNGQFISDEYSCGITVSVDGTRFTVGWPNRGWKCPMARDKHPLERNMFQALCFRPSE